LERIEDYIKYNIAPPKELEEACAERNYVYKNEYKIKALKTFSEQDLLKTFADNYNQYVKWWDPKEELINPDKVAATQASAMDGSNDFAQTKSNTISSTSTVAFKSTGSSELTEVIVTGAFGTKRTARSSASNVQNINSSQLNTIRNTDLNNALAGKVAGIQIRSQSAAKLGMTGLIRLRGENGINPGNGALYVLDGTIIPDASDINVDDIEDVTVLQGPSAAALFGPDGANGAIVINSKRGKSYHSYSWAQYRLKDVDDVDYMQQIKESGDKEVWDDYVELEKNHQGQAGFYFDMADHFFGRKLNDKGMEILLNGIESCYDNKKALKVAAYILETRKLFKEAIIIYEDIVRQSPGNLISKRDLALAYFQNGEYQKSVNMYYKVISDPGEEYYYHTGVKEVAMNEMNAVISMHKTVLDLSAINLNLVKQLPLDLKITVESNYGYVYDATITDPNMAESSYEKTSSKKDTRFTVGYGYRYDDVLNEYSVKKAIPGSYKIEVDAYRYNSNYPGKTPVYVRVVVFKNFQKANQSLEVRHIAMDDQHGTVEVAEVKW
jgi:TonB-dependent SusC/RagA subfamily outer membrane receptor